MQTVVVIGAGASGMIAALTAAEDRENHVILLERQQRVGRKLLATGNGRCNLTNIGAKIDNYHGEDENFAQTALEKFTPEAVLQYFESLGLVTVTEYGGRVYPLSNSANSVVDVLRFAIDASPIELRCSCSARSLCRKDGGYAVVTDEGEIFADKLIVACGGAAGSKLGGVMDGYELLKELGHKRTGLYPALVQILTEPEYPRSLKGVRAEVKMSIMAGGEALGESRGELQFTETGVSGPAAFDLSRIASTGGEGLKLNIDFLRDYDAQQIKALLRKRTAALPELGAEELLTGVLHNRLGRMIVKYCRITPTQPLKALSKEQLDKVVKSCKGFELKVKGPAGFESAQVTAGGVKTSGFNPETLESWFVPGLFVCGELLDVDGDCGGYNLQWAWASGRLAGRLGK